MSCTILEKVQATGCYKAHKSYSHSQQENAWETVSTHVRMSDKFLVEGAVAAAVAASRDIVKGYRRRIKEIHKKVHGAIQLDVEAECRLDRHS